MKATIDLKHSEKYKAWDELRKELETNLGSPLSDDLWLELQPRVPLPWDDSLLKLVLLRAQVSLIASRF